MLSISCWYGEVDRLLFKQEVECVGFVFVDWR